MSAPVRIKPTVFTWSGNEMVPMPRFKRQCDEQFLVGQEYVLTVVAARSRALHNFYFAAIAEGWNNLPETIADNFPTAEHLRAYALVATDQCTLATYECVDDKTARRLAINLRADAPFSGIKLRGEVVEVRRPISQSAKAMGKDEFEESCRKVLEFIATLTGVSLTDLRKEGARHFPEPKRGRG